MKNLIKFLSIAFGAGALLISQSALAEVRVYLNPNATVIGPNNNIIVPQNNTPVTVNGVVYSTGYQNPNNNGSPTPVYYVLRDGKWYNTVIPAITNSLSNVP